MCIHKHIHIHTHIIHTAIYNILPKYIRDSIKLKEITKLRSSNSTLLKHNPSTNYSSLWNKLPRLLLMRNYQLHLKQNYTDTYLNLTNFIY